MQYGPRLNQMDNNEWKDWQTTVLQERNVVENVHRWGCGRHTAFQNRTRDSDEDDVHVRDYDVEALANSLSQAFRYNIYEEYDNEEWAPCHAIVATRLLIAFELLLCIYLESIYVYGSAVFLPLFVFEGTIPIDNFRMCKALLPGNDESMSDEAIWRFFLVYSPETLWRCWFSQLVGSIGRFYTLTRYSACSEKCKKCPICRVFIEERLQVYDV